MKTVLKCTYKVFVLRYFPNGYRQFVKKTNTILSNTVKFPIKVFKWVSNNYKLSLKMAVVLLIIFGWYTLNNIPSSVILLLHSALKIMFLYGFSLPKIPWEIKTGFSKTLDFILDAVSRGILSPQWLFSRLLFKVKHWWRKLEILEGVCVCVLSFPTATLEIQRRH